MCPGIAADVFGYMTPVPLSTANSTVCVLNCGTLPWTFSRTYAAVTHNATATFAPYQAFSMAFPAIDATAFQTNDHVAFDRDQFLQRYHFDCTQPTSLLVHLLKLTATAACMRIF